MSDDAASQAAWLTPVSGAFAGMADGALAGDASTPSAPAARALAAAAAAQGGVLGGAGRRVTPPRPRPARGSCWPAALRRRARGRGPPWPPSRPTCAMWGGPGAGAAAKLIVNARFRAQVALLNEPLAAADAMAVDPAAALQALAATPICAPAAKAAGAAMLAQRFDPASPIALVANAVAQPAGSAEAAGAATPVAQAVGAVLKAAMARGFGGDDVTGAAPLRTR